MGFKHFFQMRATPARRSTAGTGRELFQFSFNVRRWYLHCNWGFNRRKQYAGLTEGLVSDCLFHQLLTTHSKTCVQKKGGGKRCKSEKGGENRKIGKKRKPKVEEENGLNPQKTKTAEDTNDLAKEKQRTENTKGPHSNANAQTKANILLRKQSCNHPFETQTTTSKV